MDRGLRESGGILAGRLGPVMRDGAHRAAVASRGAPLAVLESLGTREGLKAPQRLTWAWQ